MVNVNMVINIVIIMVIIMVIKMVITWRRQSKAHPTKSDLPRPPLLLIISIVQVLLR